LIRVSSLPNVTALILAGGSGTRLRAVTDTPKPIVPAVERPYIYYLMEALQQAGIERAIICAGYRAELVVEAARECNPGLELIFSVEKEVLGTGGALRLASAQLETELALALNGDSFCDFELEAFLAFHRQHPGQVSILSTEVDDASRYGRMVFNGDGSVLRFEEKVSSPGRDWINAGVYLIPAIKLKQLPGKTPLSLERDVFPQWLNEGVYAFPVRAPFLDIGTPESYAAREDFIRSVKNRWLEKKSSKKL
jgi:D-glycero-alpha-D-manno-heptose 1-phosphate guanylyltransferase